MSRCLLCRTLNIWWSIPNTNRTDASVCCRASRAQTPPKPTSPSMEDNNDSKSPPPTIVTDSGKGTCPAFQDSGFIECFAFMSSNSGITICFLLGMSCVRVGNYHSFLTHSDGLLTGYDTAAEGHGDALNETERRFTPGENPYSPVQPLALTEHWLNKTCYFSYYAEAPASRQVPNSPGKRPAKDSADDEHSPLKRLKRNNNDNLSVTRTATNEGTTSDETVD